MAELPPRREAFALHMAASGNATQAAKAAGFKPGSAHVTASRLLKDAKVLNRVQELREERFGAVVVDAERVLKELSSLATATISEDDPLAPARLRMKGVALALLARHHRLLDGIGVDPSKPTAINITFTKVDPEKVLANRARFLTQGERP